jgi:WD40 repeat protein
LASQPPGVRGLRIQRLRRYVTLGAVLLGVAGVLSVVSVGTASAGVAPGTTSLTSIRNDGSQASSDDRPSVRGGRISGNGRYVAFATDAVMDNAIGQTSVDRLNDVGGAEPQRESDIYVRDRLTGRTFLASRSVILTGDGEDLHYELAPANGDSEQPTLSQDGKYLAFESRATNLDNGGADNDEFVDVYFCDLDTNNNGVYGETGPDDVFDISCAVQSRRDKDANNTRNSYGYDAFLNGGLRQGDGSYSQLTLAWVQTPYFAAKPTVPVYSGVVVDRPRFSEGLPAHPSDLLDLNLPVGGLVYQSSGWPIVSQDADHVAVEALVAEPDDGPVIRFAAVPGQQHHATVLVTLGTEVRDAQLRLVQRRFDRVDNRPDGSPMDADLCCIPYGLTADGGLVSFSAPVGGGNNTNAAWISGPATGLRGRIVSFANDGDPGQASEPTLSADGRYVAYSTSAPTMHDGVDNTGPNRPCVNIGLRAFAPAAIDTCADIVVRDLAVDAAHPGATPPGALASPGARTDCASPLPAGETCEGHGDSDKPSLSDNGVVSYRSEADDLVPGDGNGGWPDMFVREFTPQLAADPLDFGVVSLGDSGSQTATVRHVGFGPLGVESVSLDSPKGPDGTPEFVVGTDGCTTVVLNQGDSCGISVTYTPTSEGERHATLTVTPVGRDPITVDLTGGVGVPPDGFTAGPNPLDFGQRLALSPSGPRAITVTNRGRVPLGVRQVTLPVGGKVFGKDYRITSNTCSGKNLPVRGSCQIGISFTSHGTGQRPAVLQIMTVQQGVAARVAHVIGLRGRTPDPTVVVNPGVVVNGRVTSVSGTNFAQNAEVLLTIGDMDQVLAQTDAAGSFDQTVLVLPHSPLTSRTVDATVATTTLKVSTTFLVVAGTFQAPDFSTRR